MKKIFELEQELNELQNKAEGFKNEGKVDEAFNLVAEIKAVKEEIKKLKAIEAELLGDKGEGKMENNKEQVSFIHAFAKNLMGKPLTDAEDKVLKNAINGEENIQIKELSTKIKELIREDRTSLKGYCTIHKTGAISGQFPVLNMTEAELVDVVDGVDMTSDDKGLGFELITFALKKKGRLFPLTESILKFTQADLISYVAKLFAKCYVMTVNKAIVSLLTLKVDGTTRKDHKVVSGVEGVVDATMTELDSALLPGSAIYMNVLTLAELAKDKNAENGLRYIQTDLTEPAKPYVNGVPVRTVAKELVPFDKADGQATVYPMVLGNLAEALMLFENEEYTIEFQRNFRANVVDNKIITYFDVKEVDKEAHKLLALEVTK